MLVVVLELIVGDNGGDVLDKTHNRRVRAKLKDTERLSATLDLIPYSCLISFLTSHPAGMSTRLSSPRRTGSLLSGLATTGIPSA